MRPVRFATVLMASAALALPLALGACATTDGAHASASAQAVAFEAQRVSDHIRTLADDSFEGRGIGQGEVGEQRTVAYITEQFRAAGLAPGGENGGWTQTVALNRFKASNVQAALSVGDWTLPMTQGEQMAISTRLPAQGARSIWRTPLVFVGYGINGPRAQLGRLQGRGRARQGHRRAGQRRRLRGAGAEHLQRPGHDLLRPLDLQVRGGGAAGRGGRADRARDGAGLLRLGHGAATAGRRRSSTSCAPNAAAERVPMEAWIQRDVAVDLFRRAGQDFEALKVSARSRDFRPVELTGATFAACFDVATSRITHPQRHRPPAGHDPSGRDHPVHRPLGPHRHGRAGRQRRRASSTARWTTPRASRALLELARVFGAGPRPERSMVMISFTAEESGLLGSEFYAANPLYPLETTVAGFNIDAHERLWPHHRRRQ